MVHVGFVCVLAVNLLGWFFVVVDAGSGLVCVPFVVLVLSVFVVAVAGAMLC